MLSMCRRREPSTSDNKEGSVISDAGSTSISKRDEGLKKKRLMRTTGHNIITTGVPERNQKYFSDLYTTLIDIQWRWNILIFLGGFVFTWIAFACFYYFQMHLHGDFDNKKTGSVPCLDNVQSFTAAYLFSIETMTTIGYGYRGQTEECPGVYLAVLLQSILGAGLQFALASLVVSKTRRAKRRSETILFSNHVCICEQDSCLQLAVRVADMRKSEIAGAHAKGFLIKKLRSRDGTLVPIRAFNLAFKSQSGRDEIFFPWPTQLLHSVDEDSPLWSLSRDDFISGRYELIVVLDGVCGSTSSSFQARKSYHTHEMKWGYRFATLNMKYDDSTYIMDLSNFHHTVPASTPLCSAQDINSLRALYSANHPEYKHSPSPKSKSQHSPSQRLYRKRGGSKKKTNADIDTETDNTLSSSLSRDLGTYSAENTESGSSLGKELCKRSVETHRSRSMEERKPEQSEPRLEKVRRCSLGDMIRTTRGKKDLGDTTYGDAKNIYRHRKSITDTYLGADIEEESDEDESDSLAILSVVSQRSMERRMDVRDVFKKRRRSVSKLFFGPESGSSGEETVEEILDHSAHSSRNNVGDCKDSAVRNRPTSPKADNNMSSY